MADLRIDNANTAAEVLLDAGFDVSTATIEFRLGNRFTPSIAVATTGFGEITGLIHGGRRLAEKSVLISEAPISEAIETKA